MNRLRQLSSLAPGGTRLYDAARRRLRTFQQSRVQRGESLAGFLFPVGKHTILLPPDHALPLNRGRWQLYDVPLTVILRSVQRLGHELALIDIGANVGDTAAIANESSDVPVLCIEGDPAYLPYLRRNSKAIGSHLIVAECLVSDKENSIDVSQLTRRQGTTSATKAIALSVPGSTPVRRMESILHDHPQFADASVLKTDTDGHDFAILTGHKRYLAECQPVVYLEYTVAHTADAAEAKVCLRALFDAGYRHLVVFDNFGNLLRTCHLEHDGVDLLADEFNAYLLSHRLFGIAVYYFDICAFTDRHKTLDQLILDRYEQYLAAGCVLDRREHLETRD